MRTTLEGEHACGRQRCGAGSTRTGRPIRWRARPRAPGSPTRPTLRLADRVSVGHDFGHGAVLARRHRNPDRTLGGWVADTAHADADAFVAEEAVGVRQRPGVRAVPDPRPGPGDGLRPGERRVRGGRRQRGVRQRGRDRRASSATRPSSPARPACRAAWCEAGRSSPTAPGSTAVPWCRTGPRCGAWPSSPTARSSPVTPWSRERCGAT